MLDHISFIFICVGLRTSLDTELYNILVNLGQRLSRLEGGNFSHFYLSSQSVLSAIGKNNYKIVTCREEIVLENHTASQNSIFLCKAGGHQD